MGGLYRESINTARLCPMSHDGGLYRESINTETYRDQPLSLTIVNQLPTTLTILLVHLTMNVLTTTIYIIKAPIITRYRKETRKNATGE